MTTTQTKPIIGPDPRDAEPTGYTLTATRVVVERTLGVHARQDAAVFFVVGGTVPGLPFCPSFVVAYGDGRVRWFPPDDGPAEDDSSANPAVTAETLRILAAHGVEVTQ